MIGLYHSDALDVTLVIVPAGHYGDAPVYQAILPGGVKSVHMSDQSMCQALILCEYRKIGGKS